MPPLAEWGEHRVGVAVGFDHFSWGLDDVVCERVKGDVIASQKERHFAITFVGVGLVVLVGVHGSKLPCLEKAFHDLAWCPVGHEQSRTSTLSFPCHERDGLVQKSDTRVVPVVQRFQNVGVEHKQRDHRQARGERGVKGPIVVPAQVSTEPVDNEGFGERGKVHGERCGQGNGPLGGPPFVPIVGSKHLTIS